MYSSPTTPTGTGASRSSNTNTEVLPIGTPIDGRMSGSPVTDAAVDQIVVSVGPYTFVTDAAIPVNARATSPGRASPPTSAVPRSSRPVSPSCTSARHQLGVAWIAVTPARSHSRTTAAG